MHIAQYSFSMYISTNLAMIQNPNNLHRCIHPSSISGSTKTRTSSNYFKNSHRYTIPSSIRSICYEDLRFSKEDLLGKGTFGKCMRGKLAHLNVCIKVLRKGAEYQATFSTEATLLSQCCHPNLPWIYGVVHQPSIIVLSLHTINHKCFTIHSILQGSIITMSVDQWKKIIHGVILAIEYLHNKSILHNDIKGNNVVIEKVGSEAHSILIDLGKGCFLPHGKAYNLNDAKRREHKKKYPHIAPDLVDGHCSQSKNSDIFSFGKLVKEINDVHLNLPALQALNLHCTEYYCNQRPSTVDIKTTITNLFY